MTCYTVCEEDLKPDTLEYHRKRQGQTESDFTCDEVDVIVASRIGPKHRYAYFTATLDPQRSSPTFARKSASNICSRSRHASPATAQGSLKQLSNASKL